ncbi:aromatic ring-opening dioxygenase catalytic subunit (LigB family) [Siphonobacter sp. BAB-5404]|nr:aromatic ring-opening dioxygenase catalytic subunit (LigB family) [Siphonobacter sp. SORGH_AS_0500]
MDLQALKKITDTYKQTHEMPVLFVGHGSPMNGIEDNTFSQSWRELGKQLPQPVAVLVLG